MPAPSTLPPPRGCRHLPITEPIAYHTILDSRQLNLPLTGGAFRAVMGRGRTQWSRVWQSWRPGAGSRMWWEGYAWAPEELGAWLSLLARGLVGQVALKHDQQQWGRLDDRLRHAAEDACRVELLPTHGKALVGTWEGGQAALQSSSNDGTAPDIEWYTHTRDPRVCQWLMSADGWGQPLPEFNSPMLLQCGSDLPSAVVLRHAIEQVGGHADLLLASMTTSKAFLEQLIGWRKDGSVESMVWLLDGGIRQRLAGQSSGQHAADKKGQTDINPLLDAFMPGQIVHPPIKPHCKVAVVRGAKGAVVMLSSANWQATNPRVEHYVILPGEAAAEWMTAAWESVLSGSDVSTSTHQSGTAVEGFELPELVAEPDGHNDKVLRVYSAAVAARRALECDIELLTRQAKKAAQAGDEFTLERVLAQRQAIAHKLHAMALAEMRTLADETVKPLLTARQMSEHDAELAAETTRLLEGLRHG